MRTDRGSTDYVNVYAELIRAAQYRGLTTYQDIAPMLGLEQTGDEMGAEIGKVLQMICDDEIEAGRHMLSSVAVTVRGKPGSGFFEQGRTLKRFKEHQTEAEYWETELKATYKAWRRRLPE